MSVNNTSHPSVNKTQAGAVFTFDSTALYVLYGLLATLIAAANAIVLFLMWRKKHLRSPTNLILLSLAVSDLCTGLVAIPLMLACSMAFEEMYICVVMEIVNRFLIFSTVTHLLVMTVERYMRITMYLRYRSLVSPSCTQKLLAGVWVFSLFASTIQLVWIKGNGNMPVGSTELAYDFVCAAFVIMFPLCLMTICYVKIFLYVKRHRRAASSLRASAAPNRNSKCDSANETKIALIFVAMIVIFILGCLLYILAAIENDLELLTYEYTYRTQLNVYIVSNFILFFRYFTALFNPILCTLFKQDFRMALVSLCKAQRYADKSFQMTSLRTERTTTRNTMVRLSKYRDA